MVKNYLKFLLSKEEKSIAEDLGQYYRVPADNRDLNYDKYNFEGNPEIQKIEEYNSHNTRRLNDEELIEMLKDLPFIKRTFDSLGK